MAYRYGNKIQMTFLPLSIEEYVPQNAPVRAYDAMVSVLNFEELGIEIDSGKVGNPQYDPKSMIKLLVYGYSYGIRGSRKLEREVNYNLSFIWLMGGLKPDYKTIAEFRRKNKSAIAKVLKQCAQICIKLDLIEGNTLFVDGSKFRGNASIKNTWTKEKCEKVLRKIDKRIEEILIESETVDKDEAGQQSLVSLSEELKDKEVLHDKVKEILKELEETNAKSINTVDPECTRINSIHGSHAGYNAQIVVDEKHGLIVSTDAVSENNDLGQFEKQIDQANETLGKKCEIACADSGYADTDELKKIDDEEIKVIVPSQRQASEKEIGEFAKEKFHYDSEKNCYVCPESRILTYRYTNENENNKVYKISESSICLKCRHYGVCTKSKEGRRVTRLINEEVREKLERQYLKPENQKIYKLRQQKVELPFGHIRRNLNVDGFLLRGIEGAKAELSLLASCFDIARMITILGIPKLILALAN